MLTLPARTITGRRATVGDHHDRLATSASMSGYGISSGWALQWATMPSPQAAPNAPQGAHARQSTTSMANR
jgi:hypothetical protein